MRLVKLIETMLEFCVDLMERTIGRIKWLNF